MRLLQWRLKRLLTQRERHVPPDPPDGPDRATREILSGGFGPDGISGTIGIRLRPPETDELLSPYAEAAAETFFRFPMAFKDDPTAIRRALENAVAEDLADRTRQFLREIRAFEIPPGLAAGRPEGATSFGATLRLESMTPFEIDFSLGVPGAEAPPPPKHGDELRLKGSDTLRSQTGWSGMEYVANFSGPPNLPFRLEVKALADFSFGPPPAAGAPGPSGGGGRELEELARTLAYQSMAALVSKLLTPTTGPAS